MKTYLKPSPRTKNDFKLKNLKHLIRKSCFKFFDLTLKHATNVHC